jgi:hypothetical protein
MSLIPSESANGSYGAAIRLHRYLAEHHWADQGLIGPDPGVRFNYRIGRFVKSYLPLPWSDRYYYVQGQGYWILANWGLYGRTGEAWAAETAVACSAELLARQHDDGYWEYPNPEWRGRIATAEGTWGAIGLLESYRRTMDGRFLEGATRWYRFLVKVIGFQKNGNELAVNYFAGRKGSGVPNNSAFVLRFLAELAGLTRDRSYLWPAAGMLAFMRSAQTDTGEFPYACRDQSGPGRPHFQCYQYNAFQCLDLIRFSEFTRDRLCATLISSVLEFLATGVGEDGHALYACGNRHRQVTYHTAVLATAFARAAKAGWSEYLPLARRTRSCLLRLQQPDGGFPHSHGDYRLFSDRRSYPRYLAMILYFLLLLDDPSERRVERSGTLAGASIPASIAG